MDTNEDTSTAAVAANVVSAMATAGMTPADLAKGTGMAVSTVRRRLAGRQAFGVIEIRRVAEALGVDLATLSGEAV